MICPNCKTDITDIRPVITDAEARGLGQSRWSEKHLKISAVPFLGGFIGVILALQIDRLNPILGFIVGLATILGSIYTYHRFVFKPRKAAGEQFLKDWRK